MTKEREFNHTTNLSLISQKKIGSNELAKINTSVQHKPAAHKSFDDMTPPTEQQNNLSLEKENKIRNAFRGQMRKSKGTDELLELKKNVGRELNLLFVITEEQDNYDDDDDA